MVLPAEVLDEFLFIAREEGLVPVRICRVKTVSAGKVKRVLMEFKKSCKEGCIIQKDIPAEEMLTIQERGDGPYTNEYRRANRRSLSQFLKTFAFISRISHPFRHLFATDESSLP